MLVGFNREKIGKKAALPRMLRLNERRNRLPFGAATRFQIKLPGAFEMPERGVVVFAFC
jgi:hypothetical protein